MLTKNERKILKLIKYTPTLIVISLIVVTSYLFFLDRQVHYEENINNLKESFIEDRKENVKYEVNRVYEYILYEKQNSEEKLKISIKSRVNEAYEIMNFIYEKYKDTETKEQIKQRIKDSLRTFRFNENRGYFYIYALDGKNILHPLKPELEGKNLINFQDKRGTYISKEIRKGLENKKGLFYELYWNKPTDLENQYRKITYNRVFKPYNWYVGSGEYVQDFEDNLKEKILSYINIITYSRNGYVFVTHYDGRYLAHVKRGYIGLNRINLRDKNGYEITKSIIKTAKEGEGFISYIGTIKPETKEPASKTTFVKGFQDWKWAIATGFYTDELEKELAFIESKAKKENQEKILEILIVTILLTIVFIGASIYLSRVLEFRFIKHKKEMLKQIEKNRKKDSMLSQQSKMAAMGEMIQNIAHQWRQPLTAITTVSTGIKFKQEYDILEKDEISNAMDTINTTSQYLSQTIEDFREFFNPDRQVTYFNLADVFDKTLKLLETQLKHKDITVILNSSDISVFGYKNELMQVFINLINNSRDEFEKNEQEKRLIFIDVIEEENKAIVKIKDNAGGIAQNIISKIFDSYFTTKGQDKGTGIGLYMSREIIEKHMNGQIKVSNEEFVYDNENHKGALFEILLNRKKFDN